MKPPFRHLFLLSVFVLLNPFFSFAIGFDFSRHSIPLNRIVEEAPLKDPIPALLNPQFVLGSQASHLKGGDRILGMVMGQEAKAYPIKILNWHELVNDRIAGHPILVTYCPSCGTGIAFDPVVGQKQLIFGVTGFLYNDTLLMYDHPTGSLWSQVSMEAVTGPLMGAKLNPFYLEHTSWKEWFTEHPMTLVLSPKTGFVRDYDRDPWAGENRQGPLSGAKKNGSLPPQEWVLGIKIGPFYKAYPFSALKNVPEKGVSDTVGEQPVRIFFDPKSREARAIRPGGLPIEMQLMTHWFSWHAFYPETTVYHPSQK